MLTSASAFESANGLTGITAKARSLRASGAKKAGLSIESRLKSNLGISPLRATGGPPGVPSAASGASGQQSSLVKPPESGQGLMSQLQAQVRSVNPLTAGLSSRPRSLGALQAGLVQSRQGFEKIDNSSRRLQAHASPFRGSNGFGTKLFSSSLDLLA